jgi:ligand-binding sensor domain-containing protein
VRAEPVALRTPSGPNVTTLIASGDAVFGLSHGSLLRRMDAGTWQTVLAAPPQTVADSNVTALEFSVDGRLWIGYFDRGLDVLDLTTSRAQHLEDDHLFCVNRIIADPVCHTMNVATANGLVLFDGSASNPAPRQVLTRRDGAAPTRSRMWSSPAMARSLPHLPALLFSRRAAQRVLRAMLPP